MLGTSTGHRAGAGHPNSNAWPVPDPQGGFEMAVWPGWEVDKRSGSLSTQQERVFFKAKLAQLDCDSRSAMKRRQKGAGAKAPGLKRPRLTPHAQGETEEAQQQCLDGEVR